MAVFAQVRKNSGAFTLLFEASQCALEILIFGENNFRHAPSSRLNVDEMGALLTVSYLCGENAACQATWTARRSAIRASPRRPRKRASAEKMQVKMEDGLTGVSVGVHHCSIA